MGERPPARPGAAQDHSADRIQVRGLRALGTHGTLPEERDRPQPFEVDVDLEADLSVAGATDRLPDTVDYGAVAAAAAGVVTGRRFNLLERLAESIAAEVSALDDRVRAVSVTVRKLRPPLPLDLASAGVTVTRRAGPAPARRRAFLGLGSNLGDRAAHLRRAVSGLPDVAAVSPVYETGPVGGADDQPPYLNLVVELSTPLPPSRLLEVAQGLEEQAGRVRGERFGPRTLDVDVLLVGDLSVVQAGLVVPHPRMWQRRFVLAPLADLAPELVSDDILAVAEGTVRRRGGLYDDPPAGPVSPATA